MGKPTGFMEFKRMPYPERPIKERVNDYKEVYLEYPEDKLKEQGARCMSCGIPFCHKGCPLGNLIPDWNDLVYQGRYKDAIERLHATNNFPEFTGRLCPAPCEGSCVLGINEPPVTIKTLEFNIIDQAFNRGLVKPLLAKQSTGKKVAVVGSGPAGLACAQQLARVGHQVTVFERADKIGGLLRYGIPDFKMEKWRIDKRIEQMQDEGVTFKVNSNIGVDIPMAQLEKDFDAIALCGGATQARDLPLEGRDLNGIHLAMEYLTQQNRINAGLKPLEDRISAEGKHVVILGGGDTGADCLGTSHRQKAKSVTQIELLPRPPESRAEDNPWPQWPVVYRTSSAHAEGGDRDYAVLTKRFLGENGQLKAIEAIRLEWSKPQDGSRPGFTEIKGSEFRIECDLVFLALGFTGPEKVGAINDFGLELDARGNVKTNKDGHTSRKGVFACGDIRRGQSLIVWAIAEGRDCASGIDSYLMDCESELPRPNVIEG